MKKNNNNTRKEKLNREILTLTRDKVLLIDDNKQAATISIFKALDRAVDEDLDLVCIGVQNNLPVCKIMNYSKWKYEQDKKVKESKKKQIIIELKEIQLTYNIGDNDLKIKAKKAQDIISKGDNVKIILKMRGRENAHPDYALSRVTEFISYVNCNVKKSPYIDGKNVIAILEKKK